MVIKSGRYDVSLRYKAEDRAHRRRSRGHRSRDRRQGRGRSVACARCASRSCSRRRLKRPCARAIVSAAAGRAAYATIVRAVDSAKRGDVDAIATAPINKLAFAKAGLEWKGHTDLLAHLCDSKRVAMMFHSPHAQGRADHRARAARVGVDVPDAGARRSDDQPHGRGDGDVRNAAAAPGARGTQSRTPARTACWVTRTIACSCRPSGARERAA